MDPNMDLETLGGLFSGRIRQVPATERWSLRQVVRHMDTGVEHFEHLFTRTWTKLDLKLRGSETCLPSASYKAVNFSTPKRVGADSYREMGENVDTGDPELDKTIKQWLEWDRNMATRQEVTDLLNDHNVDELRKRFGTRIQFGTAGLRAAMEAGTARINDLIIIQTAQGLLRYLESSNPECKSQGIVIGYDARHCSQRYAHLTAAIMLHAGIPVYLYSDIVPTPFVPYAIRKYSCVAGVMVTPSHNPKGDNGYKVYWSNSAQ
ncbi:phosphopentomutase-like, partial [Diadema antillarum]|uniref:phosphopentomutase-like n=1 Tax=Diadema antillarum TaxID=105358 RepID=UPI003A8ACF10